MEHRQRRRRELFEVKRTGNRRPIAPIPSNAILAGRGMPHLKRMAWAEKYNIGARVTHR
jgi:hypothetical protein